LQIIIPKKLLLRCKYLHHVKHSIILPVTFPCIKAHLFQEGFFIAISKKKDTTIPSTVLPVCEMDADYLHDKLHQDTPQTSYHRLAYEYYATPVRTGVDIRKAWNIPEDATLLLSIGELCPNKRFRIVL